MPYRTMWDEEVEKLYRIEFYDNWTWEEYKEGYTTTYEMLGKLDYKLDLVQGLLSDLPAGSAILNITVAGQQPPNIRHTVLLNQTGKTHQQFVEYIVGAVKRMKGWTGPKFVDTLGEARAYIRELREKEDA